MSRLTKRQALEECITLWQYLADNQVRVSNRVRHNGNQVMQLKRKAISVVLPGKKYDENCPCCEYMHQQGLSCQKAQKCIIHWSGNRSFQTKFTGCSHMGSPYFLWQTSNSSGTKIRMALKIVELAKKALADLEEL